MEDNETCHKPIPGVQQPVLAEDYAFVERMHVASVIAETENGRLIGRFYQGHWYKDHQ